jgi:hypothetical protein
MFFLKCVRRGKTPEFLINTLHEDLIAIQHIFKDPVHAM